MKEYENKVTKYDLIIKIRPYNVKKPFKKEFLSMKDNFIIFRKPLPYPAFDRQTLLLQLLPLTSFQLVLMTMWQLGYTDCTTILKITMGKNLGTIVHI